MFGRLSTRLLPLAKHLRGEWTPAIKKLKRKVQLSIHPQRTLCHELICVFVADPGIDELALFLKKIDLEDIAAKLKKHSVFKVEHVERLDFFQVCVATVRAAHIQRSEEWIQVHTVMGLSFEVLDLDLSEAQSMLVSSHAGCNPTQG